MRIRIKAFTASGTVHGTRQFAIDETIPSVFVQRRPAKKNGDICHFEKGVFVNESTSEPRDTGHCAATGRIAGALRVPSNFGGAMV